jgi:hypothetical protein
MLIGNWIELFQSSHSFTCLEGLKKTDYVISKFGAAMQMCT